MAFYSRQQAYAIKSINNDWLDVDWRQFCTSFSGGEFQVQLLATFPSISDLNETLREKDPRKGFVKKAGKEIGSVSQLRRIWNALLLSVQWTTSIVSASSQLLKCTLEELTKILKGKQLDVEVCWSTLSKSGMEQWRIYCARNGVDKIEAYRLWVQLKCLRSTKAYKTGSSLDEEVEFSHPDEKVALESVELPERKHWKPLYERFLLSHSDRKIVAEVLPDLQTARTCCKIGRYAFLTVLIGSGLDRGRAVSLWESIRNYFGARPNTTGSHSENEL